MAGSGGRRPGAGRPLGSKNISSIADRETARDLCRKIVHDETYLASLARRAVQGELPPAVETMLWYMAYGKPPEHMEHTGLDGGPLLIQDIQYASDADTAP